MLIRALSNIFINFLELLFKKSNQARLTMAFDTISFGCLKQILTKGKKADGPLILQIIAFEYETKFIKVVLSDTDYKTHPIVIPFELFLENYVVESSIIKINKYDLKLVENESWGLERLVGSLIKKNNS